MEDQAENEKRLEKPTTLDRQELLGPELGETDEASLSNAGPWKPIQEALRVLGNLGSQNQKSGQENIAKVLSTEDVVMSELAAKLETDEARVEFAKIHADQQKEKDRQRTKQIHSIGQTTQSGNRNILAMIALCVLSVSVIVRNR